MRALQYDSCGGGAAALKHVEVPIPTPAKDEVLIKLEAITINPINWKVQKGILRPFLPRKRWVLHRRLWWGNQAEIQRKRIGRRGDGGEAADMGPSSAAAARRHGGGGARD
ncbi:Chloroplast envelope quinone oxidoreductase homolog [Linum perenne]